MMPGSKPSFKNKKKSDFDPFFGQAFFGQSDRLKTLEDLGVIERTAFLYQD